MMVTNGWQDQIIEFLADPFERRSVTKFCKEVDISRETYYKYIRDNRETVYYEADRRRKRYIAHLRSNAFKSLTKRLDKSDKVLQMALEMTGDYVQKTEVKQEILDVTEKRKKIDALLRKYKKQPDNTNADAEKEAVNGDIRGEGLGPTPNP